MSLDASFGLTELELAELPAEKFEALLAQVVDIQQQDRKENQLRFYRPVSKHAQAVHDCRARVTAIGGGNGSSKTETALVEAIMCATGIFPESQAHLMPQKFRGPIKVRVVCESLTTVLTPIILPKLQWWNWTGVDQPGGERGHWGWVPKTALVDGDWQKSWSEKLRMLRVLCQDPKTLEILGESTIQFMSVDQDSTDFASGDFHIVIHDEPPPLAIWRENEARTMRVNGRMLLAMTWPDDPAINVDWLFNEVYEPGSSGHDPEIKWFNLFTTDNPMLDQTAVAAQAAKWSKEVRAVRILGQPIRFSNRVHPEFTQETRTWCFECGKTVNAVQEPGQPLSCFECGGYSITEFNHVQDFSPSPIWPTVYLLDPHPRKPHMMLWVQVDPSDDLWVVDELKVDGDCVSVKKRVDETERNHGLNVERRLMDPNMGASQSAAGSRRELTWQQEFADAGLVMELADDSSVGRSRLNEYMRPDRQVQRPRIHIHPRCKDAIYQIARYVWDDYSVKLEKDQKQTPKPKYDDFPTLLKYLMNSAPEFKLLKYGAPVIHTRPGTKPPGFRKAPSAEPAGRQRPYLGRY